VAIDKRGCEKGLSQKRKTKRNDENFPGRGERGSQKRTILVEEGGKKLGQRKRTRGRL